MKMPRQLISIEVIDRIQQDILQNDYKIHALLSSVQEKSKFIGKCLNYLESKTKRHRKA